jgi:hypothetical protein
VLLFQFIFGPHVKARCLNSSSVFKSLSYFFLSHFFPVLFLFFLLSLFSQIFFCLFLLVSLFDFLISASFSCSLLVFFFFFLVLLSCPLLVLLPFLFALLIPFILSSLYSPSLFSCSPFYFLFATSFSAFTPLITTFTSLPFSHLFFAPFFLVSCRILSFYHYVHYIAFLFLSFICQPFQKPGVF